MVCVDGLSVRAPSLRISSLKYQFSYRSSIAFASNIFIQWPSLADAMGFFSMEIPFINGENERG